ncbi:MAG: hypothetical protein AB1807_15555 [Pseudomonadota bacterium]
MTTARHLIASCLVSLGACTSALAADWVSYRDAYRAMVVFEKYGGPKHQLQNHLQVVPLEKGASLDGLQLTLAGKANQVNLALDPLGRTAFPLLKAAYDENAALLLDRRIGAFTVRPRVSLTLKADGIYDDAELRAACEQALGFARYADASLRARGCGGVRFVFARRAGEIGVRLHRAEGQDQALPLASGTVFQGELGEGFPSVVYRFAGAVRAQVISANPPLAILPLFE